MRFWAHFFDAPRFVFSEKLLKLGFFRKTCTFFGLFARGPLRGSQTAPDFREVFLGIFQLIFN